MLIDASDRLAIPDHGVVLSALASFAALILGDQVTAIIVLVGALRNVALARGHGSVAATKEALTRVFSYNDHQCYAPFVF
jgi:hypothetical protein